MIREAELDQFIITNWFDRPATFSINPRYLNEEDTYISIFNLIDTERFQNSGVNCKQYDFVKSSDEIKIIWESDLACNNRYGQHYGRNKVVIWEWTPKKEKAAIDGEGSKV